MTLPDIRRAIEAGHGLASTPQRRFSIYLPDGSRIVEDDAPPVDVEVRNAAVLILLFHRDEELRVVLTRRTDTVDHPGQISFPGGSCEPADRSLEETALRETEEEIGLSRRSIEVFGELAPVYVPPTNFNVTPFVAMTSDPPVYQPDPREVAEVLEVPLGHLTDEENCVREEWKLRGQDVVVPLFRFHEHKIWGATARMLASLLAATSQMS